MDLSSLEEKKSFRQRTEGLRGKDLWDYIWMYYKVAIITGAFLLFMAISITSGAIHNHNELKKVQLMILEEGSAQATQLWEEEASIISTPYLAAGTQVNFMIAARITANELDVSIIPAEHVTWIQAQEGITPLDDLLILPDEASAERIVNPETGEVMAVCINNTPFYEDIDASCDYVDDLYLCISARNERLPAAVEFAQRILDTVE